MSVARKKTVPKFEPPLPDPPLFCKGEAFREFLFSKGSSSLHSVTHSLMRSWIPLDAREVGGHRVGVTDGRGRRSLSHDTRHTVLSGLGATHYSREFSALRKLYAASSLKKFAQAHENGHSSDTSSV
jgi:hypothetical protein